MAFLTEKQIEERLVEEVRELPTPNGGTMIHRSFKIVWSTFDQVVNTTDTEPAWIVEVAQEYSKEWCLSFDDAFAQSVAFFHHEAFGHPREWRR